MYHVRNFFSSMWLAFYPGTGGNKKTEGRILLRCECGKLLLKNAPREIMAKHSGHLMKMAISGSWWEAVKANMGWVK